MTNRERLEWACWILERERHRGQTWLAVQRCGMPWAVSGGDDVLHPIEAIATALALDEQARRKLPERGQAEWAAGVLNRSEHDSCRHWVEWERSDGSWSVGTKGYGDELSLPNALAIAESYVRREMLSHELGEVSQ